MNKLLLSTLALSLSACNDIDTQEIENQSNIALRSIITSQALTADPVAGRSIPNIEEKTAQLGKDLFFSKSLGGDSDSACVTCHHPVLGGGDNLSLPIGTEADDPNLLGTGRSNDLAENNPEGGPPVPRNAPTTFNVALWDHVLFHDGRVEALDTTENSNGANGSSGGIRTPDSPFGTADPLAGQNLVQAQARFPVTSNEEMKGFDHTDYDNQGIRELLAGRLGGYGDAAGELQDTDFWLEKFRTTFENPNGTATDLITEQNISLALGEYQRSQVFVNTPWKSYVEGDDTAISETAKQGALLFFSSKAEGGADCASCHSGDFFTDESFHNVAMPQIGSGKGDGEDGSKDFGRFRETGNEADKFAFRTPSLLNVEVTGPWSHAGAYTSLTAIVRHSLNPQQAITAYDFEQLSQTEIRNLDQLADNSQEALDHSNFAMTENIDFTDVQVASLVEFLKTLTDPCVKDAECLAPWISTNEDPNGNHLTATTVDGSLL